MTKVFSNITILSLVICKLYYRPAL